MRKEKKLKKQSPSKFPNDDACCGAHVERMFRAKLGNLDATIGGIHHLLVNSFHFVAEDDRDFLCPSALSPIRGKGIRDAGKFM